MFFRNDLDAAISIFTQAKGKLEAVLDKCDKRDAKANEIEEIANEVYDNTIRMLNEQRTEISNNRDKATKYLNNINKLLEVE